MQQQKIKLSGISRLPNDASSANGELALAVDVACERDGIHMLEDSDELFALESGETVLCVHQNDNYRHYITVYEGQLRWRDLTSTTTIADSESDENEQEESEPSDNEQEDEQEESGGSNIDTPDPVQPQPAPTPIPDPVSISRGGSGSSSGSGSGSGSGSSGGSSSGTGSEDDGTPSRTYLRAVVMGNTLIVTTTGETLYYLWDGAKYKSLGNRPPEIKIQFGLRSELGVYPGMTSGQSPTATNPLEFWTWRYTKDVALPWVLETSETNPDGSDMTEWTAITSTATGQPEDLLSKFPDVFDFSLKDKISTSDQSEQQTAEFVEKLTDYVMAAINKFIAVNGIEHSKFTLPFFVRYCYELYDGSQIMQSAPVLMLPNTMGPMFLANHKYPRLLKGDSGGDHEKVSVLIRGRVWGVLSKLIYTIKAIDQRLFEWDDLVKSIGIYITPPVYPYKQSGKVYGWFKLENDNHYNFNRLSQTGNGLQYLTSLISGRDNFNDLYGTGGQTAAPFIALRLEDKQYSDIRKEVLETGTFYRLAEITMEDLKAMTAEGATLPNSADVIFNNSTLQTITNQHQLGEDYIIRDNVSSAVSIVYNRRLELGDVSRTFAPPQDLWTMVCGSSDTLEKSCRQAVEISSKRQSHIIINDGSDNLPAVTQSTTKFMALYFIYHPNRDARRVYFEYPVSVSGTPVSKSYSVILSEQDALNGACWLIDGLWTDDISKHNEWVNWLTEHTETTFPENSVGGTERYEGEVWASNVENPFVFQSANINQVGDGTILALSPAVAPLAEDQHGTLPIYVFTSQGVWAISISADGSPASIDHVCGDIITSGTLPLSISQSCIFMAERGLLELTGRRVRNIAESLALDSGFYHVKDLDIQEMDGGLVGLASLLETIGRSDISTDFLQALERPLRGVPCQLNYDYRNARIYVCLDNATWVYNLRTGLWTQSSTIPTHTFNAYPDCEFVSQNKIYRISSENRKSSAVVFTRPIKLSDAYQVIRDMLIHGFFSPNDTGANAALWTTLHGARDYNNYAWIASHKSAELRNLFGTGYRTNVIGIIFRNADVVVDGISLTFDVQENDKIRQ